MTRESIRSLPRRSARKTGQAALTGASAVLILAGGGFMRQYQKAEKEMPWATK